jgi:peptide/nickel transport system permease protein
MKFRANLWIGGALFALWSIGGTFAPWLAHTDPVMDANLMNAEVPPGSDFWFGTDAQGRDIYSRVLYGARISLTVGIVSQLINTVIGVALGLSAGYWGGWWDDFVNGLTNLMLAIPSLIFALAIMAILQPGLTSLLIALGLTNWSYTCRLARAATLSTKQQGYVEAARSFGYGRHPHHVDADPAQHRRPDHRHRHARAWAGRCWPRRRCPSWAWASGRPSRAGAACSRMRATRSPPRPGSRSFPGLAIFMTVLGLNLLGDGLRDILDPQSKSRRT